MTTSTYHQAKGDTRGVEDRDYGPLHRESLVEGVHREKMIATMMGRAIEMGWTRIEMKMGWAIVMEMGWAIAI